MFKEFLVIIIVLFCSIFLFGQHDRGSGLRDDDDIYCSTTAYEFEIEGVYYIPGRFNKAYICPIDLPSRITVIDAGTHLPLTISPITWSNNLVQVPFVLESTRGIPDFGGNTLDIWCSFTDSEGDQKLRLKIKRNVAVDFSLSSSSDYGFDENKITQYWPSATTPPKIPWKYIKSNETDPTEIKVSPSNHAYNGVSLLTDIDFNASPISLGSSKQDIDISTNSSDDFFTGYVHACANEPELNIYSSKSMTIEIEIFQLCETDDDVQVNLGAVSSPTDICIDPGPDGSLDEWYAIQTHLDSLNSSNSSNYPIPSWISPLDSVFKASNNKWYILAGVDSICQTIARPHDTICPSFSQTDVNNKVQLTKNYYSEIGVTIINATPLVTKIFGNYDSYKDDGKVEIDFFEDYDFYNSLYQVTGGVAVPNKTQIWIVDDIKSKSESSTIHTAGRSTPTNGYNAFIIDIDIAIDNTMGHELGHAKFFLNHPHYGDGEIPYFLHDKLGNFSGDYHFDDTKNIMSYKNTANNNLFRAYQWKIIHDETFRNSLKQN